MQICVCVCMCKARVVVELSQNFENIQKRRVPSFIRQFVIRHLYSYPPCPFHSYNSLLAYSILLFQYCSYTSMLQKFVYHVLDCFDEYFYRVIVFVTFCLTTHLFMCMYFIANKYVHGYICFTSAVFQLEIKKKKTNDIIVIQKSQKDRFKFDPFR